MQNIKGLISGLLILFACLLLELSVAETNYGVEFQNPQRLRSGWVFHGQLLPDKDTVTMNPMIRAVLNRNISTSNKVCGFFVHHNNNVAGGSFPFLIIMASDDPHLGLADVRLKPHVTRPEPGTRIKFQLEAFDCDRTPHFSERKFVLIDIIGKNSPEFMRQSYHFTLKQSQFKQGVKVGQVVALEAPRIKLFSSLSSSVTRNSSRKQPESVGGICKYEIVSGLPVPFKVNDLGIITVDDTSSRIQGQLYPAQHYKYLIRATDCRKLSPLSVSVPVTVDVFGACRPHWTGLPNQPLHYSTKKSLPLFLLAGSKTNQKWSPFLHICTSSCNNLRTTVTAKLLGVDLKPASSAGCSNTLLKDPYFARRQATLCSISSEMRLISPELKLPVNFDGTKNIEITKSNLGPLTGSFHVVWWMRHGKMTLDSAKEQILCRSDSHRLDRHHMSVFVHNCKLVLLLRHEFDKHVKKTQQYPSEWRYGPLREVCDGKWHHYSLAGGDSSRYPELLVDGELVSVMPEQLDDKELHAMRVTGSAVRDVIGACYHSKTGTFVQGFRGELAHVRINSGAVEPANNVRCLATCGETLLLPSVVEKMKGKDASVTLLSDLVRISSHSFGTLLQLLSTLSYMDTGKPKVQPGAVRIVTLDTVIKCQNRGTPVSIPQFSITINVDDFPAETVVHHSRLNRSPIKINTPLLVRGVIGKKIHFLKNIRLIESFNNTKRDYMMESCIVRPMDQILSNREYIEWPVSDTLDFHLTGLNNTHGLFIEGKASRLSYQKLLAKVVYVFTGISPTESYSRRLAVMCSVESHIVTQQRIVEVIVAPGEDVDDDNNKKKKKKVDQKEDLHTYYVVDDPDNRKLPSGDGIVFHSANKREKSHRMQDSLLTGLRDQRPIDSAKQHINHAAWLIPLLLVTVVGSALLVGLLVYRRRQHQRKGRRWIINNAMQMRRKKLYDGHSEDAHCAPTNTPTINLDKYDEDIINGKILRITSNPIEGSNHLQHVAGKSNSTRNGQFISDQISHQELLEDSDLPPSCDEMEETSDDDVSMETVAERDVDMKKNKPRLTFQHQMDNQYV